MKNKTLKNLIAVGIFAIFVLGYNFASAAIYTYPSNWTVPVSVNNNQANYQNGYNNAPQQYYYQQPTQQPVQQPVQQYYYQQPTQQVQQPVSQYYYQQPTQQVQQPTVNQYYAQQPYTYVQAQPKQQIQYVTQPATQIQYVPQQQTVNTQGASVVRSTNTVAVVNKNTGATGNTGQYVNYDANNQNMMLASAYGAYNNGQVVTQSAYDSNGVTALSVKGSGGFMPSSVIQWFFIILLILAIVIVARMVSRTFSKDSHAAPVH